MSFKRSSRDGSVRKWRQKRKRGEIEDYNIRTFRIVPQTDREKENNSVIFGAIERKQTTSAFLIQILIGGKIRVSPRLTIQLYLESSP